VIAVLAGLGAATMFAGALLSSSRSARLIGPFCVLSWVMLVGLVAIAPFVASSGRPDGLDLAGVAWLGLAGAGNVGGLLLAYTALRTGKVGVVGPILSTEGAIAAVISVLAGEGIGLGSASTLAVVAAGIALASARGDGSDSATRGGAAAVVLPLAAALCFGSSLYATGRVGADLGIAWAVLPARLIGVLVVAVPLAARGRLRLTRRALPLVVAGGLFEVIGFAAYAAGARDDIAVSAVLASQFAALAAVAAYFLFHERLSRVQVAGVVAIACGVAALTALQA